MSKININLLPPELAMEHKRASKKLWVIRISSILIAVVALCGSLALAFGFIKAGEEQSLTNALEESKAAVSELKDNEGYLNLVKQKSTKIDSLSSQDAKVISSMNLINSLVPPGVVLQTISLDKNGDLIFGGQTDTLDGLRGLLGSLTEEKKDYVNKVQVSSLNKSASSFFKFDLAVDIK